MAKGTAGTGVTVLATPTSPVLVPLRAPWPGAVDPGLVLVEGVTAARPFAASCCLEEHAVVLLAGVVVLAAPASCFFGAAVAAVVI